MEQVENECVSFEELNATTEELVVMNDEMVEQARVNDENITQLLTEEKKLTSIVDKSMNAFEKLEEMKVVEVMETDLPCLKELDSIEKAMELLIDHPFICVVGEAGTFEGILTRRQVMKQTNRLFKIIKYS